jgi:hypothetical protein
MDDSELTIEAVARAREMARTGAAEQILRDADVSDAEVGYVVGASGSCVSQWRRGLMRPTGERAVRFVRLLDRLAGRERMTA